MTALSHPTLGRPLVKALPTGSSIPSIDFEDLLELRLPRFDDRVEEEISDLVVKANAVHFAIRMAALKSMRVVGCGVRGRNG